MNRSNTEVMYSYPPIWRLSLEKKSDIFDHLSDSFVLGTAFEWNYRWPKITEETINDTRLSVKMPYPINCRVSGRCSDDTPCWYTVDHRHHPWYELTPPAWSPCSYKQLSSCDSSLTLLQSIFRSINQSVNQSLNKALSRSISQSFTQSVIQSTNQSKTNSIN